MRPISHSEVSTLLDCQAKHDFSYIGQLAGSALSPKTTPPRLREGRAWGAAVAAWHAHTGDPTERAMAAGTALGESLEDDAAEQRELGVYLPEEHEQMVQRLKLILGHYIQTADPLPIARLEDRLLVPIPSRGGNRRSNLYRLECYIDGVHTDSEGRDWIVEFKLRVQLTPFELIALARQVRWYAWGWREQTGREIAGIITDERLNAAPSEVKLNKDGRPSARQSCTLDAYLAAGGTDQAVIDQLNAKAWQQRHPLILRPGELDEVGQQLISAARLVRDFDNGLLFPIRNPSRARCPGCAFRDICPDPHDTDLVEALYERVPAKRDREEVPA